jgi:hypothetical protein
MGDDARFQDPNDETKTVSEGLTILDLVKHSVKTIMLTLSPQDRLAIVAFDSRAIIAFPLREMDDNGRQMATIALESLRQDGNTDIWAGLYAGLEALRLPQVPAVHSSVPRKSCIILLTDGQPNQSPPQGEEQALNSYLEKYPDFQCQVNTFGFGYNLNSKLLLDLGVRGKGTFSFLPDAKIVGTCFVSAVANICSNMSQNCRVHLLLKNDAAFAGGVGAKYNTVDTNWGRIVDIGPLQYGQSRDLVVSMNIPAKTSNQDEPYLEVVVEYDNSTGGPSHKVSFTASSRKSTPDAIAALVRNQVVSAVIDIIDQCEKGQGPAGIKAMKALVGKIAACEEASKHGGFPDKRIVGIHADTSGRMSKALSTVERFKRWGKHYLRALTRSHQLQIRTNFMDPGLQIYGGTLFKVLEEQGGEKFKTQPLKKHTDYFAPKQPVYQPAAAVSYQPAAQPAYQPAAVDTDTYYAGSGGGCFDENSSVLVLREDQGNRESLIETVTPLSKIKQNDTLRVINHKGELETAQVRCIVRIEREHADPLVEFPQTGLKITKRHPIRINGQWRLPIDLVDNPQFPARLVTGTSKYVYNVVLDQCHILLVNGVECVTLGHGIKDPLVYHPFYATQTVVNTLSALPGWDNGLVTVKGSLRKLHLES